ncbi:hypothetical protein N0V88_002181 [Collariella sp. IMI 366227]|nr:hypothetical protein N0V88_002181 [Collariella sp. IMI 366227]
MSDPDTFDFIPLTIDPKSKAISTPTPSNRVLEAELAALNTLHRALHALEPPHSANLSKLRESGNAEYRRGHYPEAIKLYTLGLQMALTRPAWEPSQLVREEAHALYSNRAQAHMHLGNWAEGAVDAEASVEAKRQGNAKAWFRRGKCLVEMGRLHEAREWVGKGLEFEGRRRN